MCNPKIGGRVCEYAKVDYTILWDKVKPFMDQISRNR
jgi:hypothetical protein